MTIETLSPIKLRTNIYKGCERSGGTLRFERDIDSILDHDAYDYACLQCGRHTPAAVVFLRLRDAEKAHAD
jgi:hypothetical protein